MFDQENSFNTEEFATKEEAVKAAEEAIKTYHDYNGWNDGVEAIVVGRITHRVKEVPNNVPNYCNYVLESVENETGGFENEAS